ncbi:MAG: hypothetical protein V4642_09385, partial [Bacteroidota bacterium]
MKPLAFVRFCFLAICFVVLSHCAIAQDSAFTAKQGIAVAYEFMQSEEFMDAYLVAIHSDGSNKIELYDYDDTTGYYSWSGKSYKWKYFFYSSETSLISIEVTKSGDVYNAIFEDRDISVILKELPFTPDTIRIGTDWMDSDELAKTKNERPIDFSAKSRLTLLFSKHLPDNNDTVNKLTWIRGTSFERAFIVYDATNGEVIGVIIPGSVQNIYNNPNIKL